jgi:hypothetical protein
MEAALHVSVDRKSAYIEKSAAVVKRRTGTGEVPAASVQISQRVMIRTPNGVVRRGELIPKPLLAAMGVTATSRGGARIARPDDASAVQLRFDDV